MRKKNIMALILIAGVAIALAGGCGAREKSMGEKMAKELGLSADQKAKLKDLREGMKTVRKENMEKMRELVDKSKDELLKPTPDKDALAALAKESGELRRAMTEKETDHLLKVKAVLTPDQFKKLLSKDFGPRKGFREGGHHDDHEKGSHGKGSDHDRDD